MMIESKKMIRLYPSCVNSHTHTHTNVSSRVSRSRGMKRKERGIKDEEKMGMVQLQLWFRLLAMKKREESVDEHEGRKEGGRQKRSCREGKKKKKKKKGFSRRKCKKETRYGSYPRLSRPRESVRGLCTAPTSICLVIVYRYEGTKRAESMSLRPWVRDDTT